MSAFSHLPTFSIELDLIKEGYQYIAGVDEAGRGALAGPLSLGMTIYSPSFITDPGEDILASINDSKKLSPSKRNNALGIIKNHSVVSIGTMVSHKIIDHYTINGATEYSLKKLIQEVTPKPDIIIMDGNFSFDIDIPITFIKKGDSTSISIASGSIIAKVQRDLIMEKMDLLYPQYGFASNKGYGTKNHIQSIHDLGFCKIHRKSYDPVRTILEENKDNES